MPGKAWRWGAIVRRTQIEQTRAGDGDALEAIGLLGSGRVSPLSGILVSRLEGADGANPFTASADVKFPNTIGELIAFYDHVAA
jgi:hypothetical protein